jgi:hypothetical protein
VEHIVSSGTIHGAADIKFVFMIAKRMAAKEVLKLRFLILINVLAIA